MKLLLVLLLLLLPANLLAQGTGVNPPTGSVWTYLGPTYGASWMLPQGGPGKVSTAACNGTTDVTATIQGEINTYSAAGGGTYFLPPGKRCVVATSTDLIIPYNVQFVCSLTGGGYWPDHNYQNFADILVDPAHSIKSAGGGAAVVQGGRSGMWGCLVVRKGFVGSITLRGVIESIKQFAGTAFVCTAAADGSAGQVDVELRHNMFVGFTQAVVSSCDRLHFTQNRGDATNFFLLLKCNDICEIHDNHSWVFASSPYPGNLGGGGEVQTTNVTSATISGGTLTLGFAAPPTPFVTGDTVVLSKIGGITGAQWGRFTATVVDATHISVPGSFSGSFTSGGTIRLSSLRRQGIAFNFAAGGGGGPLARNLSDFGHDIGLNYDGGSSAHCVGCWMDNDTSLQNPDPVPVGVFLGGSSGLTNYYQGYINSPGMALMKNDDSILTVGPGTQLASLNKDVGNYVVSVLKGVVQFSSANVFSDMGAGVGNALFIASAAQYVEVTGGLINGATTRESPADCAKLRNNGSTGPCEYTPTYTGAAISGTPLHAIWWNNGGRTTVLFQDTGKTVSSQTAAQFSISMPTLSEWGGSCAIGVLAATSPAGYTQYVANIAANTSEARFYRINVNAGNNDILPGTALLSPNLISITCAYQ